MVKSMAASKRATLPVWSSDNQTRLKAILLEAAICFNKKGYHGTTIEDIAERVNVTKAALYYYVKNKEELLFKCHQLALDIATESIERASRIGSSPDEQLALIFQHYIENVT